MKDTTKKKLIKTAKIAGMVMTAFFAVLGLAFSAAALNKCSGGEDTRTPITLKSDRVQYAPQYADYNYFDNYFDEEWSGVFLSSHNDIMVTFEKDVTAWKVRKYTLPAGEYIISRPASNVNVQGFMITSATEAVRVDSTLDTVIASSGGQYSAVDLYSLQFYSWFSTKRITLTEASVLYLNGSVRYLDLYTLIDLNNSESLYSVNWGFQWFPWQMMGYAGSNPVILSDISGSIEDVHVIEHRYLDGFYFRSNVKLYKKIDIMYSWASGSELTDGSGKFYSVSNANAWYIQEVRYYFGDGADDYDVVARFSVFESPTNHYNIPAYGPLAWVSSAFRQIDIVFIADDTALITTNTGSYTLSQWIEILLQPMSGDININVIQGGDPFSLMTTAFDSMKGILSIAVLPGISLGLLLFLPIIAGIIVIILRVVKR